MVCVSLGSLSVSSLLPLIILTLFVLPPSPQTHTHTPHLHHHYHTLNLNIRLNTKHRGGANNKAAKMCVWFMCILHLCVCVRVCFGVWLMDEGELWLPADAGYLSGGASVCLSVL